MKALEAFLFSRLVCGSSWRHKGEMNMTWNGFCCSHRNSNCSKAVFSVKFLAVTSSEGFRSRRTSAYRAQALPPGRLKRSSLRVPPRSWNQCPGFRCGRGRRDVGWHRWRDSPECRPSRTVRFRPPIQLVSAWVFPTLRCVGIPPPMLLQQSRSTRRNRTPQNGWVCRGNPSWLLLHFPCPSAWKRISSRVGVPCPCRRVVCEGWRWLAATESGFPRRSDDEEEEEKRKKRKKENLQHEIIQKERREREKREQRVETRPR